eukprot:GCRY01004787.1.p1 GENE.GCRY01004787.1~~GCRY01004787.1.p1  ORF type:complete len:973 (-),score=205.38 GCRY01004787.1:29-2947(-)
MEENEEAVGEIEAIRSIFEDVFEEQASSSRGDSKRKYSLKLVPKSDDDEVHVGLTFEFWYPQNYPDESLQFVIKDVKGLASSKIQDFSAKLSEQAEELAKEGMVAVFELENTIGDFLLENNVPILSLHEQMEKRRLEKQIEEEKKSLQQQQEANEMERQKALALQDKIDAELRNRLRATETQPLEGDARRLAAGVGNYGQEEEEEGVDASLPLTIQDELAASLLAWRADGASSSSSDEWVKDQQCTSFGAWEVENTDGEASSEQSSEEDREVEGGGEEEEGEEEQTVATWDQTKLPHPTVQVSADCTAEGSRHRTEQYSLTTPPSTSSETSTALNTPPTPLQVPGSGGLTIISPQRPKTSYDIVRIEEIEDSKGGGMQCIEGRDGRRFPAMMPQSPRWPAIKWSRGPVLGRGTFGVTYLGMDQHTGTLLAVKELTLTGSLKSCRNQVQSVQQEIGLMKKLHHPNIVRYIGTQQEGPQLRIFIEYIAGGSLRSILSSFGKLPETVVNVYTRQILEGLAYLHSQHIIHRDIKAANVLVDHHGAMKLSDFGCSKQFETLMGNADESGRGLGRTLRGTPYWMAPEMIREAGYGRKSDIWSLGCTVIEMLTAENPFANMSNAQSAMYQIARGITPPFPPGISSDLRDFLKKCFVANPLKRPGSQTLLKHPWIASTVVPPTPTPLSHPYAPAGAKGARIHPFHFGPAAPLVNEHHAQITMSNAGNRAWPPNKAHQTGGENMLETQSAPVLGLETAPSKATLAPADGPLPHQPCRGCQQTATPSASPMTDAWTNTTPKSKSVAVSFSRKLVTNSEEREEDGEGEETGLTRSRKSSLKKDSDSSATDLLSMSIEHSRNTHFSRYRMEFEELDEIGKGAFGTVLKAQNRLDSRIYAIKRIRIDTKDTTSMEKLLREVFTLSRLHHQHVVRYYSTWLETSNEADNEEMMGKEGNYDETQPESPVAGSKSSGDSLDGMCRYRC